jgi:hypothetical protein
MKAYSTLTGEQNKSNDTIFNNYFISNNERNVLIEYSTGTWCHWCPCSKYRILDLKNFYPNTVALAYHGGTDPWANFNGNNILSLLDLTAFPLATIDRQLDPWSSGLSDLVERPFMRYMNIPVSPVLINIVSKNYNSITRTLSVTLNSTALTNLTGQYKISYAITEDNLVYEQYGNSWCTGGTNYIHKWIVRNMVNGATGENLNTGGSWANGQTISKSFSTTLGTGWVDNNCIIKIFIYKDNTPLNMAEIQQAIETSILTTDINNQTTAPIKYELSQNYPNPFNPVTNIKFGIPKNGNASLRIYDITGRLISTYFDGYIKSGYYNAEIDGNKLSSGVYFYKLETEVFSETKKMILVK